MLESAVEKYLCDRVREAGGFTRKVVYQGRKGAPDRHCYLPGGKLIIAECKRPEGGKLHPLQEAEINKLKAVGFEVHVINTKEQVDGLFR